MLTYATLLIACLIVSVVAYFLYKVVVDSSRSVYRSRAPIALVDTSLARKGHHHKNPVVNANAADNAKAFGENRGHTTPKNFAKTFPAMPTDSGEKTWQGTWQGSWQGTWQGSRGQLREPPLHPRYAADHSGHCSLYDVNTPQPAQRARPSIPKQHRDKLHREEKVNPVGRAYKVTRKVAHVPSDDHDLNKPWGW